MALEWTGARHPLMLNLAANEIYCQLAANNGGWGKSSAVISRDKFFERKNYDLSKQTKDSERLPFRIWRWVESNLVDKSEYKKWITWGLPILIFIIIALCLGFTSLPQIIWGILQKTVGVPTPLPTP